MGKGKSLIQSKTLKQKEALRNHLIWHERRKNVIRN